MKKAKYTRGFEKFWKAWLKVTREGQGKPKAFSYWRRDRLEGKQDELIEVLEKQARERRRKRSANKFVPAWCWCQKWLNEQRYEYVPVIPEVKKETYKIEPQIPPASPEQQQKAKEAFEKLLNKPEFQPLPEDDFEQKRQAARKRLLGVPK